MVRAYPPFPVSRLLSRILPARLSLVHARAQSEGALLHRRLSCHRDLMVLELALVNHFCAVVAHHHLRRRRVYFVQHRYRCRQRSTVLQGVSQALRSWPVKVRRCSGCKRDLKTDQNQQTKNPRFRCAGCSSAMPYLRGSRRAIPAAARQYSVYQSNYVYRER